MHVVEKYNLDSSAINFGPVAHWKGICDAKFGQNNSTLKQIAAEREINNAEDYVAMLQDYIQSRPPYPATQTRTIDVGKLKN